MAKLKFTLSFHGGKADEHRVSAETLARIFRGLSDDIENVCRVISSEDLNIDLQEIIRSCKLYIVAQPKEGSLCLSVATEESPSKWAEMAGTVYASSLKQLPLFDSDEDIPKGLTRSVLENVKEYADPPNGEYEEMKLTIETDGEPEIDVVFDQKLKLASERKLVALSSPYSTSIIYGYSVQGILYGIENQNYDDPTARVKVEVDPGDGTRWMCVLDKEKLPEHLEDIFEKRVVVHGTATLRQRKPTMDIERIELLGEKPDIDAAVEHFIAVNQAAWEGEDLTAYMNLVRERD